MHAALKVTAWVLAVVVVVVLLGVGALVWTLSGGWDGIRPAAQPTDRRVVAAREASVEDVRVAATDVGTAMGSAGARLLESRALDECAPGQNTWKVQDGYTLQCARAEVLGMWFPELGASRAGLQEASSLVDANLRRTGWEPRAYGEMALLASGRVAEGVYGRADDPRAELSVELALPGHGSRRTSLVRYGPTFSEGDVAPVVAAVDVEARTPTAYLVVRQDYFVDD